jgi:ribonuclease BN (tRNA processing enzyme)
MWEEGRTKPLTLISQAAVLDQIREALELGYRGLPARFRYAIEYQAVAPGQSLRIGDASLDFAHTSHPSPNLAIRIQAQGKNVCYSGDGMFTDASRKLFSGADLLIHEAYSFERVPVHTDIGGLIEMAEREGVRRLALVHVQRDVRRNPEGILRALQHRPRFELPEPARRIEI